MSKPRILQLDVETSPYVGVFFDRYNQNIGMSQVLKNPEMLCFGAKFLGEKKIYFSSSWEDGPEDMANALWGLLSDADVVATYNGISFDEPWMVTTMETFNLPTPPPNISLDYYRIVKKNFRLPSYKLDDVLEFFGLPRKVKHEGIKLWLDVMDGEPKALAKMTKYNIQDVKVLEHLHNRLISYLPSKINMNLFQGTDKSCPKCGTGDTNPRGYAYTLTGVFQRHVCAQGHWFQGTKRLAGASVK